MMEDVRDYMKKIFRVSSVAALFLLICSASALNISWNQSVERKTPVLNISLEKPASNISVTENSEFTVSAVVTCSEAACGDVNIVPIYCVGVGCTPSIELSSRHSETVYVKLGETPYKCLNLQEKVVRYRGLTILNYCNSTWVVKIRKPGFYRMVVVAYSARTKPAVSSSFYVNVTGCGDGNCSINETATSCPIDCCTQTCAGVVDGICHRICDGFNGCVFTVGCDLKKPNQSFCVSPNAYIRCCSFNRTQCEFGSYCSEGQCLNCSRKCDRECNSPACYAADPDCDVDGKPVRPCCGNNIIEAGEDCEPSLSGGLCEGKCSQQCRCPVTTTYTTKTSPPKNTYFSEEYEFIEYVLEEHLKRGTSTTQYAEETSTTTTASTADEMEKYGNRSLNETTLVKNIFSEGWVYETILVVLVMLTAISTGFLMYRSSMKKKAVEDYRKCKEKKEFLEKAIEDIKRKFHEKKMSMDEASRKILACEKELAVQNERMSDALKRLGGKPPR